ncbi:MAG: T9SS type A sorting domain-containing protein [Bacteroidia bacterium]
MKKNFIILLLFVAIANVSKGQTPTWSETIAPIMYANCTKCHHPGGLGNGSLLDYADVVAKKYSIIYQVENKIMPPWPSDPSYRHYADERILKQSEIDAIVNWSNNGTPEGDKSKAPAKPVYNNTSKIGAYDLKVKIPTYTSTAKTGDIYRCFSIPTNLPANKYIAAVEIIPGNPKIVHHVLVFQDTTATTDNLDKADPLPGYTNFGGTGSNNSVLIAPYVPGAEPIVFPTGTGVKLFKNTRIILQIHYPAGTDTEKDSTYLIIRFTTQPSVREVFIAPMLNHENISNGPLIIPKDQVKTFYQSYTVPINATLLSVMPHMHLIGKSTKVFVKPATGTDTIPLVKINNWDFHWQGQYRFQYLQKITPGSKIQSIVSYDNTINNPNQPSNPTKTVTLGEATTSEMMLTYFYFMYYQTGDEKILQDSSLLQTGGVFKPTTNKFTIHPNPVKDILYTGIDLQDANVRIIDNLGRVVIEKNYQDFIRTTYQLSLLSVDIRGLNPGLYSVIIRTENNGKIYQSKFIKE